MVNRLAVAAGAGSPPASSSTARRPTRPKPQVKAAMLLHYAGLDDRVNAEAGYVGGALKAAGVPRRRCYVYPGVEPRLQQRHLGGALRQGGRRPRLVAHDRLLRDA